MILLVYSRHVVHPDDWTHRHPLFEWLMPLAFAIVVAGAVWYSVRNTLCVLQWPLWMARLRNRIFRAELRILELRAEQAKVPRNSIERANLYPREVQQMKLEAYKEMRRDLKRQPGRHVPKRFRSHQEGDS